MWVSGSAPMMALTWRRVDADGGSGGPRKLGITSWCPPQWCLLAYKPHEYHIYIYDRSTINHSEIGVTGTNLAKYVTSTTEYMNNMWYIIVSKNVTYVFFGDVLWTCWKQGCLNNILMYNTYVYIYIYLKKHKICFCYDCYDMNMHVYIYINMIGMGMLDEQRCWGIFWHHRKSWRTYLASFKSYIHFIPLISP
jgi:hypothetical protein